MHHFVGNNWGTNGSKVGRAVVVFIALLLSLPAFARNAKISADLDQVSAAKTVDVIVQYKSAPKQSHFDKAKNLGATMKRQHGRIKAASFRMKRTQLEKLLANDPNVAYISLDRPVKGMMDYTAVTVGADIARSYGFDGAGVGVAIVDSGVAPHQDLN